MGVVFLFFILFYFISVYYFRIFSVISAGGETLKSEKAPTGVCLLVLIKQIQAALTSSSAKTRIFFSRRSLSPHFVPLSPFVCVQLRCYFLARLYLYGARKTRLGSACALAVWVIQPCLGGVQVRAVCVQSVIIYMSVAQKDLQRNQLLLYL